MMGLGDTTRGGNSRGQIAPPTEAQESNRVRGKCHPVKEGSWQSEEVLVGYFGKQDTQRRFKHAPLVLGHQKGAEV